MLYLSDCNILHCKWSRLYLRISFFLQDLTRQLQQAKKRLESCDQSRGAGVHDSVSIGSRTSSNGSIDTLGTSGHPGVSARNHIQESPQVRG